MAVIKLKRSETSGSVPTTSDLVVGEVAINTVDKTLYARDSNDSIIKVANFGEQDLALTFPTGDYGSVASALSTDAFGEYLDLIYDLSTNIKFRLATEDLGSV
jgi:hypothetical protein|tara:strand:- start:1510 stop:1818 length:309 start_codon:yes stop_codon:yes gene_type:complete